MDCWVELGIAEESDKKAIKSSFFKLKKIINDETDPQGYIELVSAYEEALLIADARSNRNKIFTVEEAIAPLPIKKAEKVEQRKIEVYSDDVEEEYEGYYVSPYNKYFYRRFFAFVIDFIVVIFILTSRGTGESPLPTLSYILIYIFIVTPLMEASPLKGSIGKLIMGIGVVTKNGKQLSILQSFKRTFSTAFMIGLIKFRGWDLLARLINNDNLVQDNSSHSEVVSMSYKKREVRL